jgi:hypothetical protein
MHLRRLLVLLLTLAGLAAVGWGVHTIGSGKPVALAVQPPSIVWAGRVFKSPAALSAWLHSRGDSYAEWSTRHPILSAVVEGRPVPAPAPTVATGAFRPPAAGSGHSILRWAFLAVLLLLATACTAAAAIPTRVLYRFPVLAATVLPRRDVFLAGAFGAVVALVVGVLLS